jgi:hypothetical protein
VGQNHPFYFDLLLFVFHRLCEPMRAFLSAVVLVGLLSLFGSVCGGEVTTNQAPFHHLVHIQFTHVTTPDGTKLKGGREISKIFPQFVVESGRESHSKTVSDVRLARKVMISLIRSKALVHFEASISGEKFTHAVPMGEIVDNSAHVVFHDHYEFVFSLRNGKIEAFNILPSPAPVSLSVSDAVEIQYSCSWEFRDGNDQSHKEEEIWRDRQVEFCLAGSADKPEETIQCLEEVISNLKKELGREKKLNRRRDRKDRQDRQDKENSSEDNGSEDNDEEEEALDRQYDCHHHKHDNVPFFIIVVFLIFVVVLIHRKRRRDAQRRRAQPVQPVQPAQPAPPSAPVAPYVYVLPPHMDPPFYPPASQFPSHPPPPPPRAADMAQYQYGMQPYDAHHCS